MNLDDRNAIENFNFGNGVTGQIRTEEQPMNPREDDGSIGYMLCCHRRYTLGDHQVSGGWQSFMECHAEDMIVREERKGSYMTSKVRPPYDDYMDEALANWAKERDGSELVAQYPLGLLDHSGLRMKLGGHFSCDPGGWDSGQVGWFIVTEKTVKQCFGCLPYGGRARQYILDKVDRLVKAEVEAYDAYLSGSYMEWALYSNGGEEFESSCGGYIEVKEAKKDLFKAAKSLITEYRSRQVDTSLSAAEMELIKQALLYYNVQQGMNNTELVSLVDRLDRDMQRVGREDRARDEEYPVTVLD